MKMDEFKTVENYAYASFTERKSEFIGHIKPVLDSEEAMSFISDIKLKYRDATHNVYAFILKDGTKKYSDDGEPQGTGGLPMMNVLQNEELYNVCAVVTRYFGGIMLGAGGLVRAYTRGCKIAVDTAKILVMERCIVQRIIMDYSIYNKVNSILNNQGIKITESVFEEFVTLDYIIKPEMSDILNKHLSDISSGIISPETISEGYYTL